MWMLAHMNIQYTGSLSSPSLHKHLVSVRVLSAIMRSIMDATDIGMPMAKSVRVLRAVGVNEHDYMIKTSKAAWGSLKSMVDAKDTIMSSLWGSCELIGNHDLLAMLLQREAAFVITRGFEVPLNLCALFGFFTVYVQCTQRQKCEASRLGQGFWYC